MKPMIERGKARNAVAASFKAANYFSDEASRRMAVKLIPNTDASRAQGLADASNRLVQTLLSANLTKLESAETNADLAMLANRDGQELPVELGRLREIVKDAQNLSHAPTALYEARDSSALAQISDGQRADISKLATEPSLAGLVKELYANTDRRQAASLLPSRRSLRA